jgi:hypothetical protein
MGHDLNYHWQVFGPVDAATLKLTPDFEASWRQVDVRTLGWPHDLRENKLAVLCLRCLAEQGGRT